jgi:predicted GH43/DUF377 family glycosyl hydrolase
MLVTRLPVRISADFRRVIARPFLPGGPRLRAIIARVRALPDATVSSIVGTLVSDYRTRHRDIRGIFRQNYAAAMGLAGESADALEDRRLLLGAYFTSEYSLESVALFNPSMVLSPDQGGVPRGSSRFIMSLRACGEGHISSIEFRAGEITAERSVTFYAVPRFAHIARPIDDALYDKPSYILKLAEMNADSQRAQPILALLDDQFTMSDLKSAIDRCRPRESVTQFKELADNMLWLAHSNYELEFSPDVAISERVIFPVSESESRGIEDARFVRFTHDDGRVVYYATYTAYNGFRVLPQLIETADFRHFKINTLNGRCVQNKGMALFPRKVGGTFMMAARLDGENIHLLRSDNIHFWNESTFVHGPKQPWEIVQVGNCGSPIETEAGWILLIHGVGPMRQYWLGALLLDLEDPSRVIGELSEPLLVPNADERDGYVPNVVYSCGALRLGDDLIIPYGVSDSHTSMATASIPELLVAFASSKGRA